MPESACGRRKTGGPHRDDRGQGRPLPARVPVLAAPVTGFGTGGPHPCRWCSGRVVDDGRGSWVHETGRYRCRNEAGVPMEQYAEPVLAVAPLWADDDDEG